jgi:hypothetical protein
MDVDLVLLLEQSQLLQLSVAFPEPDFYLPPLDVLIMENVRPTRGRFNIIHIPSGLKADCYTSRNHPGLPWALANRKRREIQGTSAWVCPAAYIITHKLDFLRESGSEKHLRDIRGILQCSPEEIDREWLDPMVAQLGLTDLWERCLASTQP